MAERLSALEASFLALERPGLPMHVAAVALLDASTDQGGPLTMDELQRLVGSRLARMPRFSQRVRFTMFAPCRIRAALAAARPVRTVTRDGPPTSIRRVLSRVGSVRGVGAEGALSPKMRKAGPRSFA
jgi:hypothetical protein